MQNTEHAASLEESLMDLHQSVTKLIKVIQENSSSLRKGELIMDKLPLLDFYNDDLLRNINSLRGKSDS